ncbi:MAG TPA: serine/threonine-protein kinase [Planctomycetota bacterium]
MNPEHAGADSQLDRPDRIGPYRILDTLGEGGMGIVYLAEQEHPVVRRVALKLIKLGMDTKSVVARFAQERQALALMDHEGIAKVYDCGANERGQPYFAMELVKGTPLDQFCEQQRLSLGDRLRLLQQVCAAVQHAHHKGVVHRDLKPSNVLVCDDGGRQQIKIIDFGLAKAMGPKLVEATLFTEAGQVIGTPEYMAPEQADPTNHDIDTRADVYSLGVILYQSLVGDLPFPARELRRAGLLEMQRILREIDPPKPSTKITSLGNCGLELARARRVSLGALKKALRSDLDWVVLKALEKERNRRYETANALSADLQRFLDHEPLLAGPPSAGYRVRKLLRRHRGQVLAAATVLLTALGGTAVALQYAERATENAVAARQRADDLERVVAFQAAQMTNIDPQAIGAILRTSVVEARPEDRESVEAALTGVNFTDVALAGLREGVFAPTLHAIAKNFDEKPLIKASLLQAVADALMHLGLLDLAGKAQDEVVAIRRGLLGNASRETLQSIFAAGVLIEKSGDLARAEPFFEEALAGCRTLFGADDKDTLAALNGMGYLRMAQGRPADAEACFAEAIAGRRRALGPEDGDTLVSINNMGFLLHTLGRHREAEPYYREALRIRNDDATRLNTMNNLGCLLGQTGREEEGENMLRDVLDQRRALQGTNHSDALRAIANLGRTLLERNKAREAASLLQEHVSTRRRLFGSDDGEASAHLDNLALAYLRLEDFHLAESTLRECLALAQRSRDDARMCATLCNLGHAVLMIGKMDEAVSLLEQALEFDKRLGYSDKGENHALFVNLGDAAARQGNAEKAIGYYREAHRRCLASLGPDDPETLLRTHNFAYFLKEHGSLQDAEALFADAVTCGRRVLGEAHPDFLTILASFADLRTKQDNLAEAEVLLRELVTGRRRLLGNDHVDTVSTIAELGNVLSWREQYQEAEALCREVVAGRTRSHGEDDEATLTALHDLGALLYRADKVEEAHRVFTELLARTRRAFGNDCLELPDRLLWTGLLLMTREQLSEAEPLFREGLERSRKLPGTDSRTTQTALTHLCRLLHAQSRFEEAVPLAEELHSILTASLGKEHEETLDAGRALGVLLVRVRRPNDALQLLEQLEPCWRRSARPDLAMFLVTLGNAHSGLATSSSLKRAEACLVEARGILLKSGETSADERQRCADAFVTLYECWHRVEPGAARDRDLTLWQERLRASRLDE